MVVFKKKKIVYVKSLGEDLEKARLAEHLSYLAIEKKTGIRKEYLESMGNGEWSIIPGEIYARVFLKKYCDFLSLDWSIIQEKFENEINSGSFWVDNKKQGKKWLKQEKFVVATKIIRNFLLVLLAIVIVLYVGYQLWSLVKPPKLEILYPKIDFVSSNNFVKVLGVAEKESRVFLNGQEFVLGDDGFFLVDINLKKGLNVIKFEARKKYGRSRTIYREITVN